MPTADHCRAKAEEADRLAGIVSYARDKTRLQEQARSWRDQAEALDAQPASERAEPARGRLARLRALLPLGSR